jgi:hypothetical protein
MGVIEVKYFNSFILRKTLSANDGIPVWNGSRGDNTYGSSYVDPAAVADDKNWSIEESRIRGGYNNTSVQLGVKAYLVEDNPNASRRLNSMIYSGIFNSRTGVNDTNVFSIGEDIVKSVNPSNGSIQRLHAENTNLTIFQESKVSRALIDKDAIYSAEGSTSITASNAVIGDIIPYSGSFGISKNPESFALYGFRKYFTDKDRNAVLRLSSDGLTEISNYGMSDYFRDQLSSLDQSVFSVGKAVGAWDIHNKQYVLSLQPSIGDYSTVSFDDSVNGFPSFFSYKPDQGVSLKNSFYTMKDGILYIHNSANAKRGNFYGVQYNSSVTFIFNPKVSMSKVFKTINYEGSNGWEVTSFESDITGTHSVGTPINVPIGSGDPFVDGTKDTTKVVYSYNQGSYDNFGNEWNATSPGNLIPPINHAGFTRKENKYMSNLVNSSQAAAGEVVFGAAMTGIKGYFATVTMTTDSTLPSGAVGTNIGGVKELFAASSEYVESSY